MQNYGIFLHFLTYSSTFFHKLINRIKMIIIIIFAVCCRGDALHCQNIVVMKCLWSFILFFLLVSCSVSESTDNAAVQVPQSLPQLRYGLEADRYDVEPGEIAKGDFFGGYSKPQKVYLM